MKISIETTSSVTTPSPIRPRMSFGSLDIVVLPGACDPARPAGLDHKG
jgi:hypothetical protein